MSKSARTMYGFSIYLFILGAVLIVIPNVLLRTFGVPTTDEVWIRVVGVLVFIIGFYYFQASHNDMRNFYQWSVYGRIGVLVFFIVFAVLGLAPPILILFGLIDAGAAVWTQMALRSETQN